jgi:hypothetical protein
MKSRRSGQLGDGDFQTSPRTSPHQQTRGPGFIAGVGASLQPRGFADSLAVAQGAVRPGFFHRPKRKPLTKRGSPGGQAFQGFKGTASERQQLSLLRRAVAGRQTRSSTKLARSLGLSSRLGDQG